MDTSNVLTRRELFTGLAALGAAGVLRGQGPNPRAIDCHHHFVSPAYIKALEAKDGRGLHHLVRGGRPESIYAREGRREHGPRRRGGVDAVVHYSWGVVRRSGGDQ